jgi:hypothetical protein
MAMIQMPYARSAFSADKRPISGSRIKSQSLSRWTGAALFVVFLALAFNLRQRDLEFMVEPDFFWAMIHAFVRFFQSGVITELPIPAPHVYLDASHILYGAVDIALRQIVTLPNDMSYALGAAMFVNMIAYAAACTIFYAAVRLLTNSTAISALMAAGLFFAPQIISINLGRLDFLVMLPLMIVFYCSCAIACGIGRTRHAVWLGIGLALGATLKISGLIYGLLPACAVVAAGRYDRPVAKFILASGATFVAAYLAIMFRYVYYLSPAETLGVFSGTMAQLNDWSEALRGSWSYYNYEILKDAGRPFLALYFLSAAATMVYAIWRRSPAAIFLVLAFIGYSVLGILTLKYSRGGYHLLPLIFAMIGFVAAEVLHSSARTWLKAATLSVLAILFAASAPPALAVYGKAVTDRKDEAISLQATKREPRDWLRSNVPPGTKVCIQTSSVWSIPPLDGYTVDEKPLGLPYLDSQKLANTAPPSLTDVASSCAVIVTSDLHRDYFEYLLKKASTENTGRWSGFFKDLSKAYPPKTFTSPAQVSVKRVDIFDLRNPRD